ncbi:hypothetical protein HPB50_007108 [Hyalomma asiaticum]|uniref:Uncharacterized protein n=1 Tax=Hyalomma asiaticum TaxID=266040 RepID=A0ACB7RUS4_HYAAI|nr:hypothetical protein HPB50_007108 [Hyalomma asiaticum]
MFAVVRFLDDVDVNRHVIPESDVKNFDPENDPDFDKYATYSTYWRDPVDDEDTGFYKVQILMFAVASSDESRCGVWRVPTVLLADWLTNSASISQPVNRAVRTILCCETDST